MVEFLQILAANPSLATGFVLGTCVGIGLIVCGVGAFLEASTQTRGARNRARRAARR